MNDADGAKKSPDSWPVFNCLFTIQPPPRRLTQPAPTWDTVNGKAKVIQQERETGGGISPVFQTLVRI